MKPSLDDLIENVASPTVAMHNPRECNVEVQTERPWHRAAMYMMLAGQSHVTIAAALEKTPVMVSIVSRQPWFQQQIAELARDSGGDEITTLLKGEAKNCLLTLLEVRDDPNAKNADRITSCKDLLDRHLGKAVARVEVENKTFSGDPQAEYENIAKELETLRQKQTNLPN